MGGGKLKKSVLGLLVLAAGFLVIVPKISAQDEVPLERDPRAAETVISLDGNNAEGAAANANADGASIWAIIRMILVLALVAAAIYGIVFVIKRAGKKTDSSDPFLKVLATSHLGSNRYAHIVSVGSKAWLLGASDGGVNLIGEIDDRDVINSMLLSESAKSAQTSGHFPDFLSFLRRLGAPAQSRTATVDDIRRRRERLKGL